MGKKHRNRNKKNGSLATFLFNPVDIVMLATGKHRDGIPVITETKDYTDEWLSKLKLFSEMTKTDTSIYKEVLDYAFKESSDFASTILEYLEPAFIAIPAYQDIEELIAPETETMSSYEHLLAKFTEALQLELRLEAAKRGIHVLIVPFMANSILTDDAPDVMPLSNEMKVGITLLAMKTACEEFLKGKHNLPGSSTVLPLEIDEDSEYHGYHDVSHNYENSTILTLHFNAASFVLAKESDGTVTSYEFTASMYSSDPDISEDEADEIDSFIETIFDNHTSADIIFIDSGIDTDGHEEEIILEHLEEIVEYSIPLFITEAINRGIHVIMAPRISENALIAMYENSYNTDAEVSTYSDKVMLSTYILEAIAKDFIKHNNYLPGSVTLI